MTIFGHVKENMKSRVKGDFHARFCGKAGVKFPCLTRLYAIFTSRFSSCLLGLGVCFEDNDFNK